MKRLRRHLAELAHDERGSEAIQIIGAAAIMGLVVAFLVAGGRIAVANMHVESASYAAARSATLARDVGSAVSAAQATASQNLAQSGINCASLIVDVDANQITLPLGQTGLVNVTISCTVPLGDISLPGLPMAHTIQGAGSSPTDPYSQR